jgi:hypothetical protein
MLEDLGRCCGIYEAVGICWSKVVDRGCFVVFFWRVKLNIKKMMKIPEIPSPVKLFFLFGLLIGIWFGLKWLYEKYMTGGRVDVDSNMLMTQMTGGNPMSYLTRYRNPDSFEDYVFAYDPKEVYFDTFSVFYTRQRTKLSSGMLTNKGGVFPDDPTKRMISLPMAANASRVYRQPSSSKDGNFVVSINASFFYTPKGNAEELEKFKAISSKGRFMVKKNGKYRDVQRSSRPYFS